MIFVTVGSQKFQFNRLLKEIDRLIEEKKISSNEVYAQIGYSSYEPHFYSYERFLNSEDFLERIDKSNIIITHGGTGSIITAVKKQKKVIGIPRALKYGEHVDNHQFEIIEQFSDLNLILGISEIKDLGHAIELVQDKKFKKYKSNTDNVIGIIQSFLNNN